MKGLVDGYQIRKIKDEKGYGFYIEFLIDGNPYLTSQTYYEGEEKMKRVEEKLDDYINKTKEANISRSALDWPTMLRFAEDIIFYDE